MPIFAYKAFDQCTKVTSGVVEADSPRAARQLLLHQGLRASRLRTAEHSTQLHGGWREWAFAYARAMTRRERVLESLENLVTLLESGVTMEAAWLALTTQSDRTGRRNSPLIHGLHAATSTGVALSQAMAASPLDFDSVDVALVRAGEDAGELAGALSRLVARRRLAAKLSSTIIAALAYPCFLMLFGCGVVIFLATYVIPNINSMLLASGGSVPRITSLLQGFAWFLGVGLIPLCLLLAITLATLFRRVPSFRKRIHQLLLRVPVAGRCWRDWQLAQFTLVLHALLASAVHLPDALELAGQVCGEGPVQDSSRALRERVLEGHDLGEPPSRKDDGLPPWLWRALAVGQRSGDLAQVLARVGRRFEESALRSAARLGSILEPLMILLVGAFVGMVAYAALLPIIRLNSLW